MIGMARVRLSALKCRIISPVHHRHQDVMSGTTARALRSASCPSHACSTAKPSRLSAVAYMSRVSSESSITRASGRWFNIIYLGRTHWTRGALKDRILEDDGIDGDAVVPE